MTNSSSDLQKSEDKVFTSGIDAIIERMRTHPDEFFEYSHGNDLKGRWRFMFKDYFRDAMTETEKGRLHEALKQIRRMEFDTLVVKELMRDELVVGMDVQQELFGGASQAQAILQQTKAYTGGSTGVRR
jgi:hypothetical protein